MIIVCEPQCKGISHEKVNAGYIYGLLLAYPKDKIIFFAHPSHYCEIKDIFKSNKISFDRVKNRPINFNPNKIYGIGGVIKYLFLINDIFDQTIDLSVTKIYFLSSSPVIIYISKLLIKITKYKNICCTYVLHGELEDIANVDYIEPYVPVIKNQLRFSLAHPGIILLLIRQIITKPIAWLDSNYSLIFKKFFRMKKVLMWQHSDQFNYISMSPHITQNAKKYLDVDYLNFHTIILPIIFAKPTPIPDNKYVKFAVFGYGDSAQMQKMLALLSKKEITKPYEIRIISMDSRGTEGFPNITRLSKGKILSRKEMEGAVCDIDIFINLYDKSRHRFGCSLSILESLSYLKPVLHLSNPGYNYFNKSVKPIGFRVESLNGFVEKMCDLIENYQINKRQLCIFRNNMLEYRKEYDIKNNLDELRKCFLFD
jgi:hypothetical protein